MTNDSNRFFHSRSATRLRFEATLAAVLLGLIGLANVQFAPGDRDIAAPVPRAQETIEVEEILRTIQPLHTVVVPMAAPIDVFEEVADDVVLEKTELRLDAGLDVAPAPRDGEGAARYLPAPPPPPAATPPPPPDEAEIFVVVEEMPEIEGGLEKLYSVLQYPELARRASVEGRVVVELVIEKSGKPSDPHVVRSANPMLDEAAIEAVMKLTFKPGKQRGKAVRVRYTIPIRFELNRPAKR